MQSQLQDAGRAFHITLTHTHTNTYTHKHIHTDTHTHTLSLSLAYTKTRSFKDAIFLCLCWLETGSKGRNRKCLRQWSLCAKSLSLLLSRFFAESTKNHRCSRKRKVRGAAFVLLFVVWVLRPSPTFPSAWPSCVGLTLAFVPFVTFFFLVFVHCLPCIPRRKDKKRV